MSISIAFAGDTMLGRGVGAEIASRRPYGLFADEIREYAGAADLFAVNLECCISARGHPWDGPEKLFHFRAPPQAADALAELGVTCVTLANNHALDFGYAALADTVEHLSRAGICATGAGADQDQARAPCVVQAAGVRVTLMGVTDHPADFAAGPDLPGVAYADLQAGVPHWLTDQVRSASTSAPSTSAPAGDAAAGDAAAGDNVVLVLPHWGPNMTLGPLSYIRRAARSLTEAGATLVAGSSAHAFHGVAGRVLYDLGDFIDDYATDAVVRNDLGLLFLVTLDGRGPRRIEALPLKLDYARTEVADGADRAWITDRFTRACRVLGTNVREEDGHLVAEPDAG